MAGPFAIFIGGQELTNWTDATLSRSKDDLTGTLNFSLFMSYVPDAPVLTSAITGAEVVVYVGGQMAFKGSVDKRRGTGAKHGAEGTKDSEGQPSVGGAANGGASGSVSIGPDEYTVKVTCRGVTKKFVDSSHTHPTTNMLKPTNRDVVDKLIEGSGIVLEWLASSISLDKVRFRDGATIWEELARVGTENAHFMYQTRDGKLRVTDDTGRTTGDPLILGENILTFSAEQSEDNSRAEIKVKGQRTPKEQWGEGAVLNVEKTVSDGSSTNKAVVNLQHYGDATPEALERRANFEANKRVAASKSVNIDVFHVQSQGGPWDVGTVHYVEVPPEGIFDAMECTGLTYTVDADKTLKTALTLSPLPAAGISGGITGGGFGFASDFIDELVSLGASRRARAGATTQPGQYPASWGGAQLSIVDPAKSIFALVNEVFDTLDDADESKAPDTIPPYVFRSR